MSPDILRKTGREKISFGGYVRRLEMADLESIKPILEYWLKDRDTGLPLPSEVNADLELMRDSVIGSNSYKYFTAVDEVGRIVGVIGMRPPDQKMVKLDFLEIENPVELVNAYVDPQERGGKGVGRALVHALELSARIEGYTEVILNSGPRYKLSGWGFYDKLPGYNRVGLAVGYYGPGGDAQVWKKSLVE